MTLIDLGEVGSQEEPADTPPPAPRWLRNLGVPARGKASAVAALAILAGTLAGTAPDAGPVPFHTIPALDLNSSTLWSIDGVVVQYKQDGTASVTDLASGRRLWSAQFGDTVVQMDRGPEGTILLQTSPGGTVSDAAPDTSVSPDEYVHRLAASGTVTVLDLRTGAERFSHRGALLSPYGAPDLLIQEKAPQDPAGWRMTNLDFRDGHEVWTRPMPDGTRFTYTYDDDFMPVRGGLLVMDARDGSVVSIGAGGEATPRGRVEPGGNLEWAWSDYVGVSYPMGTAGPTDGPPPTSFELHDLRTLTSRPLWALTIDPSYGSVPWFCGMKDRLCTSYGGALNEIRIQDGLVLGPHEQPHYFHEVGSSMIGLWTIVGGWSPSGDEALAVVMPALSKTGVSWLGAVRVRDGKPLVTPLTPTPVQITACWLPEEAWIVCNGVHRDGTAWDRSLVLRKSDVDDLVRRYGAR